MKKLSVLISVILTFTTSGCVGIGAPILSPELNAKNAEALLEHGRPLPAERLIEATIDQSTKKNDERGLARAYGMYAQFLQSPTVTEWETHYRKNGFINQTITFDNRHKKSREYWYKALDLYIKTARYDAASNAYLNLVSLEFFIFKNKQKACEDLTLSLQYNNKFTEAHPGKTVTLDKGYTNFGDYITAAKEQLECESLK